MFHRRIFAYLPNYRSYFNTTTTVHPRLHNQHIANIQTPTCKDCVYFYPGTLPSHIQSSLCLKYGEKDLITGDITYKPAYMHRHGFQQPPTCGRMGAGFSKKHEEDAFYGCP
jgi:hypothetical protein